MKMAEDPWYSLGSSFLRLPARASRDGEGVGEVIGTALHVELFGYASAYHSREEHSRVSPPPAPPTSIALAFEAATGEVVTCIALRGASGFEVYEEVLWGVIRAYMERLRTRPGDQYKPATLMTSDPGLADYMHGLLQGSGLDIVCVNGATQQVQWPSRALAERIQVSASHAACGERADGSAPAALLVRTVLDSLLASLESSGQIASVLNLRFNCEDAESNVQGSPLVLLASCHDSECGLLVPRSTIKRCSECKRTYYCSATCQKRAWTKGGHRKACKDIQQINSRLAE
jgi:hypothetical protein